jgi:hypothetical protein
MDDRHGGDHGGLTPPLARQKLLRMYLATAGLYSVPWFHRSLRTIEEHTASKWSARARTLAFACFPAAILQFVLFFRSVVYPQGLHRAWQQLMQEPWLLGGQVVCLGLAGLGAQQFVRLLVVDLEAFRVRSGGLVYLRQPLLEALEFLFFFCCWVLPSPFRLVALCGYFPLRRAQIALNNYLDRMGVRGDEEFRLTWMEWAAGLALGSLLIYTTGGALVQLLERFGPRGLR